jgi:hypothetical protein
MLIPKARGALFDIVEVKGCGLVGADCCAKAITGQAAAATTTAQNFRRRMFILLKTRTASYPTGKGTGRDRGGDGHLVFYHGESPAHDRITGS